MSGNIVYRLEPVLKQKEEAKNEATRALAVAQKKLDDIKREIENIKTLIAATKEEKKQKEQAFFERLSNESMLAKSIQVHQAEMKAVDLFIEEQLELERLKRIEEKNTLKEIDSAKDRLLETTREYKTMLKHKENYINEQKLLMHKKEQKEMDEISSLIYNFKGKGED